MVCVCVCVSVTEMVLVSTLPKATVTTEPIRNPILEHRVCLKQAKFAVGFSRFFNIHIPVHDLKQNLFANSKNCTLVKAVCSDEKVWRK